MNEAEKIALNRGKPIRVLAGQTKNASDNVGLGDFVRFEPDSTATVKLVSTMNPEGGSLSDDGMSTGNGVSILNGKNFLFSSVTVTSGAGIAFYAAP